MSRLKIGILAASASLLWSTAFVGVKIGLSYTTPFFLAGIRFFLAGIILIPFSGGKGYLKTVKEHAGTVFLLALLQTGLMYGLFFTAMDMIPGYLAAIIIGSSPLITASITHLFLKNDRFNTRKLVSLIIGVAGIIFIVAGRQTLGAGSADITGVILLILSIIFSATGNILVSEGKKKIHPVLLNSSQLIAGGALLILVSLITEGIPGIKPDIMFVSVLLYLSFISAAAFSIWFYLLNIPEVKVSELNIWKFLIPVFGAVFSWMVLPGESPTSVSVTGMIVISASIFFYFRK